jgi:acyl-CoA reductase-like NAD-dependent aldehyde dehydrogenase
LGPAKSVDILTGPMETRLLIRGEQVPGGGPPLDVENPATEETVARVGTASAGQLDAATAGAREAARGWAATPAVERAEMLHEVAGRLRERTGELARVMTLEGGKPLIENSDEVGWTAAAFDYYAEMGRNFAGRELGQEGLEAFQETKHVHIETKIAPKEWWYPYGAGTSG